MPYEIGACNVCGDSITITSESMVPYVDRSGSVVSNMPICSYCRSRMITCEDCENLIQPYCHYYTTNDNSYCPSCFVRNGWRCCQDCDQVYHEDEGRQCSCYTRELMMPYNYRDSYTFYRLPDESEDVPCFGAEVEMEATRDAWPRCAERIGRTSPYHILKGDGSLNEYGSEMAFHPMSLAYMNENPASCTQMLRDARSYGYRADTRSSCGIHVHVGRSYFRTVESILKYTNYFIGPVARAVSQRRLRHWTDGGGYCTEVKTLAQGDNIAFNHGRYVSCNTTPNETIEARIFQSSITPWKFLKCIEYCKAALELSQISSWPVNFGEDIVAYTMGNEAFPNLNRFYNEVQS